MQTQSLRFFHHVLIHELAHSMLLDAMAMGTWGGSFGFDMLHSITAIELGWLHPDTIRVGQDTTMTIRDTFPSGAPAFLSDDSTCVIIQTQDSTTTPQYFLLENRRHSTVYTEPHNIGIDWNPDIAPGSGLLITHINHGGIPTIQGSDDLNHTVQIEVASGTWSADYEPDPDGRASISNPYGHPQPRREERPMNIVKLPLGTLFLLGVVAAPSPTHTAVTYEHSKDGDISIDSDIVVVQEFGADGPIEIVVHGRLIPGPDEGAVTFGAFTTTYSEGWPGLFIDRTAEGIDVEGAKAGETPTEMTESLDDEIARFSNGGSVVTYGVSAPYPSPSAGRVTIEFTIAPEHSDQVTVEVFDVAGRSVRSLVEETLPKGSYRTTWDGRNADGRAVAAGAYFVRVQAGSFQKVEKVVMVR